MPSDLDRNRLARRSLLRVLGVGLLASSGACAPPGRGERPRRSRRGSAGAKEVPEGGVKPGPVAAPRPPRSAAAPRPPRPVALEGSAPPRPAAPTTPGPKVEPPPRTASAALRARPGPPPTAPTPVPPARVASPSAAASACPGDIDAGSAQMRKVLQYEAAADGDKHCSSCLQFLPETGKEPCGRCKLFTGPVMKSGYCLSFAPAA